MNDTCFFLQHDQISQRYQKRIELHHLPKEQQQLSGVPNNVLTFLSNSACVLASSNGLLLCHTINDDPLELFICNPITKSCFFIPTPDQRYQKRIELHHLPKEQQQLSGVPNNVLTFLSNSACVLASSNGLLLCHTINDDPLELFICNPITKSCFFIPTP
ncbi:hypothetical protein RYX36_014972, partial [Vicia faba]